MILITCKSRVTVTKYLSQAFNKLNEGMYILHMLCIPFGNMRLERSLITFFLRFVDVDAPNASDPPPPPRLRRFLVGVSLESLELHSDVMNQKASVSQGGAG